MKIGCATLEMLAMKIHESYLTEQTRHGIGIGSTPALAVWAALEH
jgi:hypothetical protein